MESTDHARHFIEQRLVERGTTRPDKAADNRTRRCVRALEARSRPARAGGRLRRGRPAVGGRPRRCRVGGGGAAGRVEGQTGSRRPVGEFKHAQGVGGETPPMDAGPSHIAPEYTCRTCPPLPS